MCIPPTFAEREPWLSPARFRKILSCLEWGTFPAFPFDSNKFAVPQSGHEVFKWLLS